MKICLDYESASASPYCCHGTDDVDQIDQTATIRHGTDNVDQIDQTATIRHGTDNVDQIDQAATGSKTWKDFPDSISYSIRSFNTLS